MTEKQGGAWFKIDWNPQTGLLHGEGNLTQIEALAVLEMEKFALLRQMARGEGQGVLAETSLRAASLQARRADQVD